MNAEEQPAPPQWGCLKGVFISLGIAIALAILILFLGFGRNIWALQFIYHLCAGWILHGIKGGYHLWSNLGDFAAAAILPILAALVALGGFHRLVLWWRRSNGNEGNWRFKHTLLAGMLVLLGSTSAIALSGVLHEAVWLPQGKVIRHNHSSTRALAAMYGRELMYLSQSYRQENGHAPSSMEDLKVLADRKYGMDLFKNFARLEDPAPPEPFVLVPRGGTFEDVGEVMLVSPLLPENEGFIVFGAETGGVRKQAAKFVDVINSIHRSCKEAK